MNKWIEQRSVSGSSAWVLMDGSDVLARVNPFDNGEGQRWSAIVYSGNVPCLHRIAFSCPETAKQIVEAGITREFQSLRLI